MLHLSVSNIAWAAGVESALELIACAGAHGVEVAPAQVADWQSLNPGKMERYRRLCESFGLRVSSFQAFLYGLPDLQLLAEHRAFQKLEDHVRLVCELAEIAGAETLVFGAPKNRLLLGADKQAGEDMAAERLAILAEIAWAHNTRIALEAVPEYYGGEMITTYTTSHKIIQTVSHPGLVFHLDTGCTWLSGESIDEAIFKTQKALRHFHVSQPDLADFTEPADYHTVAAKALSEIRYNHWVCIEMKRTETPERSLQRAIEFVRQTYGV